MGEWTWLFTKFPVADVELMSEPFNPQVANVLVRTIRQVPGEAEQYDVRVAPHNVAPFRGGPWIHRFTREELESPGGALTEFRNKLWEQVSRARLL